MTDEEWAAIERPYRRAIMEHTTMATYKITFNTTSYTREETAYITASTGQSAVAQLKRAMPQIRHIVSIDMVLASDG